MKRIGILGGTFNPIHVGHLMIAQIVHEKLKLDKVIFVPSYTPPHKSGRQVASARERLHMVRLAVKGNPNFCVSDFEVKRAGRSFSIETIKHLRSAYPAKTKFFFIIGNDLLPDLHTWRRVDEIVKMATFVAVSRPGCREKKTRIDVKRIQVPGLEVSSSYLRGSIAAGRTIRYLVPDSVLTYIKRRKLYQK